MAEQHFVDVYPDAFLHRDRFGRVFMDMCETETEHLVDPVLSNGERACCRHFITDPLNQFVGKKINLKVTIEIEEVGDDG